MRIRLAALSIPFITALCAGASAAPRPLVLFDGAQRPGIAVKAVAPDADYKLEGATVSADLPAGSAITVTRAKGPGKAGALRLRWQKIWKSGISLQGAGVDLRPYLARGTLAFDLKVDALQSGGIAFKVGCGPGCERNVSHVLAGRAAEGKGWRRIVLSLACFARDGDDVRAVQRPFTLEGTGSGTVSIANVAFAPGGTPNTTCPDPRTVAVTPAKLDEAWSIDWWLPRHRAKLEEARRMVAEGRSPQLVFIGDSITQGWEKSGAPVWARHYARYNPLDLGFGGDRTENVLWRLENGALDGLDPKLVVLMVGTNNTGHRADPPADTVAGIRRNLEAVRARLPNARILLLAIFPRGAAADDPQRRLNDAVNGLLPALADGQAISFLDINRVFLDAQGQLAPSVMPDYLHPEEHGYALWAQEMQPALERLMALPRLK